MSFLKFWGKKDKKDDSDDKRDDPSSVDPEAEKRRLRHSLSISRSGRFKQKKRERGQIMDKPEIFGDQDGAPQSQRVAMTTNHNHSQGLGGQYGPVSSSSSSSCNSSSSSSAHKSSPQSTCRDVNKSMARGRLRIGQSVVT